MCACRTSDQEGKWRAEVRLFEKAYTTLMLNGHGVPTKLAKVMEAAKFAVECNNSCFWYIVIMFNADTEADIEKVMEKLVSKKWIGYYWWSIEWSPEKAIPHVNLLISKNKCKSHVLREVYSTVKNYVKCMECINISAVKKGTEQNVKAYSLKPQDDQKREDYHFESYYSSTEKVYADLNDEDYGIIQEN